MIRNFFSSTLFMICIIASCDINTAGGDGGASETVNAKVITGDSTITVNISSDAELFADIRIFSENYNPVTKTGYSDSAMSVSSDSEVIFKPAKGTYNVIIRDSLLETSLAVKVVFARNMTIDTVTDTLGPCGSIQGNVKYNRLLIKEGVFIPVYLAGTPFYTKTDTNGNFHLQGVPRGNWFIEAVMPGSEKDIRESVRTVGKEVGINSTLNATGVTLIFSD